MADSPEAVALALLNILLERGGAAVTNISGQEILRMYAQCLVATNTRWLSPDCRGCPLLPGH